MTDQVGGRGGSERRTADFERNRELETLLAEVSRLLGLAEEQALKKQVGTPPHATVFVLGAPRVGTTLTMQWLAASGAFCYPTNLLSRFYAAPYIGILIQKLLCNPEYDFRGELFDLTSGPDWTSDVGKTRGALSPHEFWYFWRRFFSFGEVDVLDPEQRRGADRNGFIREIAAMQSASGLPLAMKAGIVNFEIPLMTEMFQKAVFVHVTRNPFFVIQSVLEARERHAGSRDEWYSYRPPEYRDLCRLHPIEQVAGQVFWLEKGITQGLESCSSQSVLRLPYERLCSEPGAIWSELVRCMEMQGDAIPPQHPGPMCFPVLNRPRVSRSDAERIVAAWRDLSGETLDFERWRE